MEPSPQSSAKPHNTSTLRVFTAGVAGATVVALAVAGLGLVVAGAQEPATVSTPAVSTTAGPSTSGSSTSATMDPTAGIDDAAWAAYDACFDANLGAEAKAMVGSLDGQTDGALPGDAVGPMDQPTMDAVDAQFQAADLACRDLLPADVQAEIAAWDGYDACMADIGFPDTAASGSLSVVSIDTPDGFQTIDLGSGPASVTITSDGATVSVESTGDATVLDNAALDAQWAEFDKAAAACDQFLPEDALTGISGFAPGIIDAGIPTELPVQG